MKNCSLAVIHLLINKSLQSDREEAATLGKINSTIEKVAESQEYHGIIQYCLDLGAPHLSCLII